jgi:endoglucanase Acf2
LRVAYPGSHITANKAAIFGSMPGGGSDFIIGHSQAAQFPHPNVASFSDWFVTLHFATNQQSLSLSFGHGSPFVYGTIIGGDPDIEFPAPPQIWFNGKATLGIESKGNIYALFGPADSSWNGLGTSRLTCHAPGRGYFSIALLPRKDQSTLKLFQQSAHSHVTDTRVAWSFDTPAAMVETTFNISITNYEGTSAGTLLALYPHQWRNTSASKLPLSYQSIRGSMQLVSASSFSTKMRYPGVLPGLPKIEPSTATNMPNLIGDEIKPWRSGFGDTYWEGKRLGRLADVIPIAEQYGLAEQHQALLKLVRERLEQWFTAVDTTNNPKRSGLFCYDERWGTLIGFPAGYGSNTELNDHHFHYGYFLRAAAEVARNDPAWAQRWGGMIELLIRDIASPDRHDGLFPFQRCFDPYAGHSWASGHAKFGDGNNQESSSEAMNAWYGIILWSEATGNAALRDLGIYLYTTEMNAIQEYWFNVHGDNFPSNYPASVVTMVWGGKGANATWFSANPQLVHAINWLPIHAGSLYLGLYPEYVEKNYRALVSEFGSDHWNNWPDLIWMYRALQDPADALRLLEAAGPNYRTEDGNSRANTAHWIHTLNALGQLDRTVTADTPLFAVFQKQQRHTYITCTSRPRLVTFSDGTKVDAKTGFTVYQQSP